MEAVRISEISVHFNVTTRRYISEDSKFQNILNKPIILHRFFLMNYKNIQTESRIWVKALMLRGRPGLKPRPWKAATLSEIFFNIPP
jgi:hypothetical protein